MDVTSLARELTPYVVMALPYLTKTGEKAAEVVTKKITEAGLEKIKVIWQRIRLKIEAKPAALEAIQDALQSPDDQDVQATLRRQLQKLLEADEALADEVAQLWAEAKTAGINVTGDRNVAISGNVSGSTVITGDHNQVK